MEKNAGGAAGTGGLPKGGSSAQKGQISGMEGSGETSGSKKNEKPRERKLKFSYAEQREWDTIEDDMAALEESIAELEKQIEASATNYGKLNQLMEEKAAAELRLEEKMERWMYLNDLAEQIAAQKQM